MSEFVNTQHESSSIVNKRKSTTKLNQIDLPNKRFQYFMRLFIFALSFFSTTDVELNSNLAEKICFAIFPIL